VTLEKGARQKLDAELKIVFFAILAAVVFVGGDVVVLKSQVVLRELPPIITGTSLTVVGAAHKSELSSGLTGTVAHAGIQNGSFGTLDHGPSNRQIL
jgi:hypothetical protein